MTVRTASANAAVERDPYGDASDVALLAARASFAAERILSGAEPRTIDRAVLREFAAQLASASSALQYVDTKGVRGRRPAQYHSVGLAVEAVAVPDAPTNAEELVDFIDSFVDDVGRLLDQGDRDAGVRLVQITQAIAKVALKEAGSTGDSLDNL